MTPDPNEKVSLESLLESASDAAGDWASASMSAGHPLNNGCEEERTRAAFHGAFDALRRAILSASKEIADRPFAAEAMCQTHGETFAPSQGEVCPTCSDTSLERES
jgi:hypothetical protein